MNLDIHVREENEKSIIFLAGEIDAFTAPRLKEKLLPIVNQSGYAAEVDFHDVTYMDSTGLGVFVNALKLTKEHGSSLQLVNVGERVLRIFRITGLDEIMDIHSATRGGN